MCQGKIGKDKVKINHVQILAINWLKISIVAQDPTTIIDTFHIKNLLILGNYILT